MAAADGAAGLGPVIALAGRRIDAADADVSRFPLENVEPVRSRIRDFLSRHRPAALVSAAASGADLLALAEAGELGIPRRIVLPFDAGRFRDTSVTDRPGDWGDAYDRALAGAGREEGVTVMDGDPGDEGAYVRANEQIVAEAARLAWHLGTGAAALVVWDGAPRDALDLTLHFRDVARAQRLDVHEIATV